MLRSRYGSEIRVTGTTAGFSNLGPGEVTLQDMLITGDQTANGMGIATSVSFPLGITCLAYNVAIYGFYFGYYGGGQQRIIGGSTCACVYGVYSQTGAAYHIDDASGIGFIPVVSVRDGLLRTLRHYGIGIPGA